ncbi:MAG: DUF1580 domain-containing protein [Aureliella sp.]
MIAASPQEKLLPLLDAIETATGHRPHIRTAMRWAAKGSRGIRLSTKVLGGRRLCSAEAVRRFMDAVTEARDGVKPEPAPQPKKLTVTERHKRLAEALR